MLLSSAVVFVSALIGSASEPASADGAWACGGEVNVAVGARLAADGSEPGSVAVAIPPTLEPGVYDLRVKTVDNGPLEVVEPFEQVVVIAAGATLGPTPDIDDSVQWAYQVVSVGQLEIGGSGSVTIQHAKLGSSAPHDLTVSCLGFTLVSPLTVVDLRVVPRTECVTGEIIVDLDNVGGAGTATVDVGGDVQTRALDTGESDRTAHALPDGSYAVTVTMHGVTVFDDVVVLECGGDGGDGLDDGGDGAGDGDGDGGIGPGDGGDGTDDGDDDGDGGPDDGASGDDDGGDVGSGDGGDDPGGDGDGGDDPGGDGDGGDGSGGDGGDGPDDGADGPGGDGDG
ncbi:MAG: hypothetical protein AAGF91_12155, partial [Actinomycetota bacterium]